jgi:hypothetical protein
LADRSSRPHHSPTQLELEKANIVLELRRKKRMTAAKIAAVLHLARSTVARLLNRNQLGRLRLIAPQPQPLRHEWTKPGDMVHIDTKKLGRIGRPGHRVHGDRTNDRGASAGSTSVAIDDHTRLAYVEVLKRENLAASVAFLQRACAWYARHGIAVQRVLTDNGTAYKDQYTAACANLGACICGRGRTPRAPTAKPNA